MVRIDFQTVTGFLFHSFHFSNVQIKILGWRNFYPLIFRIFSYWDTLSKQRLLTGSVSWKVQCWPLMWSAGLLRIRAQHCVSLGERRLQRRPQLSSFYLHEKLTSHVYCWSFLVDKFDEEPDTGVYNLDHGYHMWCGAAGRKFWEHLDF